MFKIVLLDGDCCLIKNGFILEGVDDEIVFFIEVGLWDGQIKGFIFVWLIGDEECCCWIFGEMWIFFICIGGILVLDVGFELLDDIDLLFGLEVCCLKFLCIGFFIDGVGIVVMMIEVIGICQCIIVNEDYEVEVFD